MQGALTVVPQFFLTSPEALERGFENHAFESPDASPIVRALDDSYIACGEGSPLLADQLHSYRLCFNATDPTTIIPGVYPVFAPRIAAGIQREARLFRKLLPRVQFQLQIFDRPTTAARKVHTAEDLNPEIEYAGRYAMGEVLGSGTFAVVYSAIDQISGKPVAVKIFCGKRPYAERMLFWEREVAVLERLQHPHIARLLDAGINFGWGAGVKKEDPYIVMEHAGSRSVGNVLVNENKVFSWGRAKPILLQICSALEYLHRMGLVYRDLKTDHIALATVEGKEIAKLIDFGLVLDLNDPKQRAEEKRAAVGTIYYMSPEALRGEETDPRSDIYSMGILMYVMLTDYFPFGGSEVDIRRGHLYHYPLEPGIARPDLNIPRGVEKIISKAMSKFRRFRYQSMAQMAAAIAACDG